MSRFVPKRASRAKPDLASKRLTVMKSEKVDSDAKVSPGPIPLTTAAYSSDEKRKYARMGSCEKSTESVSGEFSDICVLLSANLLKDVDACTKYVDSIGKVIHSDSLTKHPAYLRRSSLFVTMQKTLILVARSMWADQDAVKSANEVEVALMAQLRSVVENIEKLEFELVVLKGFDIFTPTYV